VIPPTPQPDHQFRKGNYNSAMPIHLTELHGDRFFFRSMSESDGMPEIGGTNYQLGLRLNAGKLSDVEPDAEGYVDPEPNGLSVSPDNPFNLKEYRLPPEWGGTSRRACAVWCIGETQFGNDIAYQKDPRNPNTHGFLAPSRRMAFERYNEAIRSTRDRWRKVIP
jgi:hypothetical protein